MHVIFGAGPVGSTTALQLVDRGIPVRIVSRSGSGPEHAAIERVRGDAADPTSAASAASGADVVYNALNPPYTRWAKDWPAMHRNVMDAAAAAGVGLVLMDNLYSYGDTNGIPLSSSLPMAAAGVKGKVRAAMADELLARHRSGALRATIARASDFFGPLVVESHLGERVVPRVLRGKPVRLLGSLDQPHSLAYMPDVARTLVTLGTDDRAWGRIWHVPSAPAVTQRQAVEMMASLAGTTGRVGTIPTNAMRALALVVPLIRELRETEYQFREPFVVDAGETETTFGLLATPLIDAMAATIAWWRAHLAAGVPEDARPAGSHSVHIGATIE